MKEEKTKETAQKSVRRAKKQQKSKRLGRLILILLIIIIVIVGIVLFVNRNRENGRTSSDGENTSTESYVEEIESGVKINKSTKLNEAKEVSGFLITNIQLTTESGMTTLLADVKNNTGNKTGVQMVDITLLDQDGKELTTVTGIIDELEAGDTTQLNIAMTSDYINAYDFKVNLK